MKSAMKKILLFLLPALATTMVMTACEVGSADDVAPVMSSGDRVINVSGVYRNSDANQNNGNLVDPDNGVTYLNLRQNGDQLEAIDNGRVVYRGSIGSVSEGNASFNVEGITGAGRTLISGNISVSGNQGVMRATLIEPNRTRNVYGIADGPTISTNTTTPTNANGSASISISLSPLEIRQILAVMMQPQTTKFYSTI